jgi:hypothetical protein
MQVHNLEPVPRPRFRRKTKVREKTCTIRRCNLCERKFLAASKFQRFCLACKTADELYHFHETLPSLTETVV